MNKALELEKNCFACGENNPIGLKMKFAWEGDAYVSRVTLRKEYESFEGAAHGGMIGLLLDEVMARSFTDREIYAVTAKMEVNYKLPTPVEEELTIKAWGEKQEGRKYTVRGAIYLPDGQVCADATALMIKKREE